MTTRKIILFAIAIVLLIFLIVSGGLTGGEQGCGIAKVTPTPVPMEKVVAAKRDIPPYTILSREDVTTVRVPPSEAMGTFFAETDVVGLMTTTELRAMVPDPAWVEGNMLIFSFYVPTARIVGGQLRPGHHIDLLATRPEQRDRPAESKWVARNLWVVGVYQASGEDVVRRPLPTPSSEAAGEQRQSSGGALGGFAAPSGAGSQREGPANLVVVAAPRETGQAIGDYLGAQQYDAWVYVRPGPMAVETPVPSGRIDGVVFEDKNANAFQERDERGLEGVNINLLTVEGALKISVQTLGDGKFFFDQLESGSYVIEEIDPEGYESVDSNRRRVELASGLNLHLSFADRPLPPTPTPTPTMVPTPTPVPPPTPTPTPLPVVTEEAARGTTPTAGHGEGGTGGPLTQETPGYPTTGTGSGNIGDCKCSVHLSNQANGPEIERFPVGIQDIWAVVGFEDCPAGLAYTVRSYYAKTGSEERVDAISTWDGGSGQHSIKLKPFGTEGFVEGAYVTFLKVGPENAVCDFRWWFVDPNAGPLPVPQASYPISGPRPQSNGAGFGFGRGR